MGMTGEMADATLVARLRRLDAAAVSDALDRCGMESGVASGLTRRSGSGVIAGRAVTVLLGAPIATQSSEPALAPRHLATGAVESAGPDEVIVIAHQGRSDCAGWGGNLSRAALQRGVAGTLVDGAVRDVDEAAEIGYGVFSSAVTPRTARGRTSEHAWNVDVTWCNLKVRPGDLVIADSTGAVVIPADHADEVIAVAESIAGREAAMAADIALGVPVSTVMGASYEQATRPPDI
jgi:4-hydroxy-4-methyl-2-oxoglutarate aldolase